MVDFNNETTISRSPVDIVATCILERRFNFIEADESSTKQKLSGAGVLIATPRARLRSLFIDGHALMKRKLSPENYQKLRNICFELNTKPTQEEILEAFLIIDEQLDASGLLRLDTKPVFNRNRIEESNKAHGYG